MGFLPARSRHPRLEHGVGSPRPRTPQGPQQGPPVPSCRCGHAGTAVGDSRAGTAARPGWGWVGQRRLGTGHPRADCTGPRRGLGWPGPGVPVPAGMGEPGTGSARARHIPVLGEGHRGRQCGSLRGVGDTRAEAPSPVPPEQSCPQRARRCGAGIRAGRAARSPGSSPASETMPSQSQRGSVQTLLISGAAGRSVRCGAVRAPRARALLPPRPSCGDARQRRAGSTGAASFSSARPGRPPPSAEPRGAGRAGRDGEGRRGGRGGGGSAPAAPGTDGESAHPFAPGRLHLRVRVCIPCIWGSKCAPHPCERVCIIPDPWTHEHPHTCVYFHTCVHPMCLLALV